jgi:hypothetical protein
MFLWRSTWVRWCRDGCTWHYGEVHRVEDIPEWRSRPHWPQRDALAWANIGADGGRGERQRVPVMRR